jgi:hypothetical protein
MAVSPVTLLANPVLNSGVALTLLMELRKFS